MFIYDVKGDKYNNKGTQRRTKSALENLLKPSKLLSQKSEPSENSFQTMIWVWIQQHILLEHHHPVSPPQVY